MGRAEAVGLTDRMRWAVVVGGAVMAWALFTFAPSALLAVAGLVVAGVGVSVVARSPELAVVALLAAALLDVLGRVGSVAGVTLTLYQVAAASVFVFLVYRVRSGQLRLQATKMDLPVAILLLLAVVGIPGALEPTVSLVMTVSLLSSAFLYYATTFLVDDARKARVVVWGVIVAGATLGALAFAEHQGIFSIQPWLTIWGTGIRARTTFKDPNHLGTFLMTAIALGVPMIMATKERWLRFVGWLAALAAAAGLYGTLSRGAWVGTMVALGVIVVLVRVPVRRKVFFAVIAVAVIVAVALFVLGPAWVEAKFVALGDDDSWMARIYMGESAVRMAVDHPLGVGMGNYPVLYPSYRDAFVRFNLIESHTAYLTVLVELGFVGLGVFLWLLWRFFAATLVPAMRERDPAIQALAVGAIAAGLAICAQSLTYSLEASKYLWLTLGLGIAAVRMHAALQGGETS